MVLGSTCEDKIATQPYQDFKKMCLKSFYMKLQLLQVGIEIRNSIMG